MDESRACRYRSALVRCIAVGVLVMNGLWCQVGMISAQEPGNVPIDSRVRIMRPRESAWIVGRIVDVTPAQLRITTERDDVLTVGWDQINRLEISQGRHSHFVTGAALGGVVLGGAGLALGVSMHSDSFWKVDTGGVVALTAGGG